MASRENPTWPNISGWGGPFTEIRRRDAGFMAVRFHVFRTHDIFEPCAERGFSNMEAQTTRAYLWRRHEEGHRNAETGRIPEPERKGC